MTFDLIKPSAPEGGEETPPPGEKVASTNTPHSVFPELGIATGSSPRTVADAGKTADAGCANADEFHTAGYQAIVASTAALSAKDKETVWQRYLYLQNIAIFATDDRFDIEAFCRAAGATCTQATRANPYQAILRITNKAIQQRVASSQGIALKWAVSQCGGAQGVSEYLRTHKGIPGCVKEARDSNRNSNVDTSTSESTLAAPDNPTISPVLAEVTELPAIPVIGLPVAADGEIKVLLTVSGSRVTFVRLLGEELASEIPAEPAPREVPGAGNSAEQAGQAQIDATDDEKETA